MKDNLNIEKLFQEKLGNFEADVSPNLWNNIQQGIGTNAGAAVAAKTSVSILLKKALIGTGIVAAGVTGVYYGFFNGENSEDIIETPVVINTIDNTEENNNQTALLVDSNESFTENEGLNTLTNEPESIVETEQIIPNETEINNTEGSVSDHLNNEDSNTSGQGTTPPNTTINTTVDNDGDDLNSTSLDNEAKPKPAPTGRIEMITSSFTVPSEISFKANAKNHTKVLWNFGDGFSAEGESVKHVYDRPGNYMVTLTVLSQGDLTYTESQTLEITTKSSVDNIPNVFTPDGDRVNDLFTIQSTELKNFYMVIYDRSGNKIYETSDKEFRWDGTDMGGNPASKGIYTYQIKAVGNDGAIFNIPGEVEIR